MVLLRDRFLWPRLTIAVLALPSRTKFSGCPECVASRADPVKGIPVDLDDVVFRVPELPQVCIPFLNGLPTDDESLRRLKNRIAREYCGSGGGIAVVVCLLTRLTHCEELLGCLWIGQVFFLGVSRQSKAGGRRCGRLWCKSFVDEYDTVRVGVPGGHPDLPIIALTNIKACPMALDWERFAVLALPSLPIFSGCPQFVASRTYQVSGILVDLGDAVFRVPPLVQVCIVFLNGLPTNDRPLCLYRNKVARV